MPTHTSNTKCCESVIPQNCARSFKNPAHILLIPIVKKLLQEQLGKDVIEIGAGNLRNSLYLQNIGHKVSIIEVKECEKKFSNEYDKFRTNGGIVYNKFPENSFFALVIMTFVIETICMPEQRLHLLKQTHTFLETNGFLILATRGPKDLVTATASGKLCSDGFVTPINTFARAFTMPQINKLLKAVGFKRVNFLHKISTKDPEYLYTLAWKE